MPRKKKPETATWGVRILKTLVVRAQQLHPDQTEQLKEIVVDYITLNTKEDDRTIISQQ